MVNIHKTKKRKLLIFLCIILLLSLLILVYFFIVPKYHIKNYRKNILINYNEKYVSNYGKVCYGNIFNCKKIKPVISSKVDTKKLGKYKVKYTFNSNKKDLKLIQNVSVVDKTKPKIIIENKDYSVCPNGKISNLKVSAKDNYDGDLTSKIKTEYKNGKIIIKVTDSNKNQKVKSIAVKQEDKIAPVITLNGLKEKTIFVGNEYNDEGATVTDNCDENLNLDIQNQVNTSQEGTYKVIYKAIDSSNNASQEERVVNVKNINIGYRTVYLTFDDGPSEYTSQLLDVLKKYNVKVTFFVTGHGSDDIIKREYDEGHRVAIHTNTHDYSYLYSSVNNYFDDLYAIQNRVKNITGYTPTLIRFPGGSSNTVSSGYDGGIQIMSILTNEVESRGFKYFDWNVSSGDAGGTDTADGVFYNVVSNLKEESSVVLQHDTQKFSVDAVERIIQYGQENGYIFLPLDETSPTMHHGVNN